jgi:(p)ppGpp synthase/HD superfamily hydrolase
VTGRRRVSDLVSRFPKVREAIEYGEREHAGHRRSFDARPFMEHPLEVGLLLWDAGAPEHVIAAGILHDTVEKAGADPAEIRSRFGERVTALVLVLTEDPDISGYTQRKAALRQQVAAAGPDALTIFAADKVSKVRELRLELSRLLRRREQPARSLLRPRRAEHYRRSLGMLEEQLGPSRLVDQLRSELRRLDAVLTTARAGTAVV